MVPKQCQININRGINNGNYKETYTANNSK